MAFVINIGRKKPPEEISKLGHIAILGGTHKDCSSGGNDVGGTVKVKKNRFWSTRGRWWNVKCKRCGKKTLIVFGEKTDRNKFEYSVAKIINLARKGGEYKLPFHHEVKIVCDKPK